MWPSPSLSSCPARAASLGKLEVALGREAVRDDLGLPGGYRPLTLQASGGSLGGGNGSTDPLVMDDSVVVTLP